MENLPQIISLVFGLTTILALLIFYKATGNSKNIILILIAWLLIQAFIALSGFYTITDSSPPRFMLLVVPPLLVIIILFITAKGKKFIDGLSIKSLTILHTIRVLVELVLFWLFVNKKIPQLMTFEGRNFDILSGLSAPLIYYFGFVKKSIGKNSIILWNFFCIALLLNIVVNAVLSVPYPFQKFAFDQPNIAVLYFPFNWLPAFVVPLVLFSHLASIRLLIKSGGNNLYNGF